MSLPGNRRALMFANMRSGTGRRAFFPALASLKSAGVDVIAVQFNLNRDSILDAVRDAKAKQIDLVIAFGGDGTIGTVIDAIVDTDVILGVIPAGTSNNFARSVDVPCNIRGAVATIASGTQAYIDLGQVNGHYFAHAAIMGLNVDFARHAERLRGLLGRLSYPVAALMMYRSRKLMTVVIEASDTNACEVNAYQVAILRPGQAGRMGLTPEGSEERKGSLSVLAVTDLRLSTVLRGLPRIMLHRHLGFPDARHFTLTQGTVSTEGPQPMTLDGEIKTVTPGTVRAVPAAVRVMVPQRVGGG